MILLPQPLETTDERTMPAFCHDKDQIQGLVCAGEHSMPAAPCPAEDSDFEGGLETK